MLPYLTETDSDLLRGIGYRLPDLGRWGDATTTNKNHVDSHLPASVLLRLRVAT